MSARLARCFKGGQPIEHYVRPDRPDAKRTDVPDFFPRLDRDAFQVEQPRHLGDGLPLVADA